MARAAVTKTTVTANPVDGISLVETAADTSNKNQFKLTGREILVARNSGASPRTVTVTSAPDRLGRSLDITADSIPAGETHIYSMTELEGWLQTDGNLYFEANHAEVKFSVIKY